ncbi:hypothetical protein BDP55DRAFT_301630 [Colletotrichum godetiae]|uniref:Uncharacterized protein n=1 Tax=Colletotrichum godetiae TaxID=1209918 RepID=A0AAJ0AXG2_9PEZI|nr:uncharacterized protein BDP55DRAFT_301630 [Colletotrichum godetiae]KAK1690635.1 hypothetical protein BDP55DRAFT_301630 [Colletotrichum godetiae]
MTGCISSNSRAGKWEESHLSTASPVTSFIISPNINHHHHHHHQQPSQNLGTQHRAGFKEPGRHLTSPHGGGQVSLHSSMKSCMGPGCIRFPGRGVSRGCAPRSSGQESTEICKSRLLKGVEPAQRCKEKTRIFGIHLLKGSRPVLCLPGAPQANKHAADDILTPHRYRLDPVYLPPIGLGTTAGKGQRTTDVNLSDANFGKRLRDLCVVAEIGG